MMKSAFNILSAIGVVLVLLISFNAQAVEIREVRSSSGVTALLVEDYTLPLISLSYAFGAGTSQDPDGRTGNVRLMSALIDEGAGDLDSASFQAKLEDFGIEFSFSSARDFLSGGLRFLRSDRQTAFEMLNLALTEPRFDPDAIERMRDAIRTGIERSRTNPGAIASIALNETLFGEHPYSRRAAGNEQSIKLISRDDIVAMHKRLFARDHLTIGVVGAISESELKQVLDVVFSDLPLESETVVVTNVEPKLGETVTIDMPVPNTNISLVYKGLKRDDPDFFAAHLMNHILGGGTFSSRLYSEVREKRGLAYGVYSGIAAYENAAYLTAGTSTRADNQVEAVKVIRGEITKLAEQGVTVSELEAAKKFVIGSYAINNLDTSGKIARVLVAIQTQNLGIDYIDKREALIDSVTLEDVNRVAKKLLSVDPTQIVVGPAVTQ
ncbi:MAG: M16 family metallopeptidase [Rhizobiaceae bacterium]